MNALHIGTRREVCWDEYLMEQAEGIRVQMHKPEARNVVFTCDKPWEGNDSGYFALIHDEGRCRIYYRGRSDLVNDDGTVCPVHKPTFCYAETRDGKTWERVTVGEVAFWGSKDNNIIRDDIYDNMFFFKDTNPDCPPEERYKGLAEYSPEGKGQQLFLFVSNDGIHFTPKRLLADDGAYDSLNVAFWDDVTQKYWLFYRGIHGGRSKDGKWDASSDQTDEERRHCLNIIRDIRVRTSTDFFHWDTPQMLQYSPADEDLEMYTNNVQKYYRAKHMFVGFPMRYIDRYHDAANFAHLPDRKHRQDLIRCYGRVGTAMTDGAIMTSRDGYAFCRPNEAFMTPEIERGTNWYYGDCGICYGMMETASDIPGAPNEISLYYPNDYRAGDVKIRRYVVRLDGFFSWHCDYKPGRVVTKPIIFDGNNLSINFATSAIGYVRIRLLDADGNVLEGYDSGRLFGDSVDRTVDFEKKLANLAGKEVRMEISMSDAELYSFKFEEIPAII